MAAPMRKTTMALQAVNATANPQETLPMPADRNLIFASIFFAIFWTAGMIWWNAPGIAGAVIFMIAGVFCGIAWYAGMRLWMTWCSRGAG
jgi:hypothetical protein